MKELTRKQSVDDQKHEKIPSMQIVFLILCHELNFLLFSCDLVIVAVMYKNKHNHEKTSFLSSSQGKRPESSIFGNSG